MTYGRNRFKKDNGCNIYHIEMDIAGGTCGIEAGAWDGKTVSAAPCPYYEDCTDDVRNCGGQAVKGGDGYVEAEILQGICKGQAAEKAACILGEVKKGSIIGGKQCTGYGTVQS